MEFITGGWGKWKKLSCTLYYYIGDLPMMLNITYTDTDIMLNLSCQNGSSYYSSIPNIRKNYNALCHFCSLAATGCPR